jgi:hypothetical protein
MKPTLDFSLWDKNISVINPHDVSKQVEQYGATSVTQNAAAASPDALQRTQAVMCEIVQGIKTGKDPYPILLQAVWALSFITGDKDFYNMSRDVMQGMGMLEPIPSEWEQESTETSLQKLKAARSNIDNAIMAQKQQFNGKPIGEAIDFEDEYDRRIKRCFKAAFNFFEENKHPRSDSDWERIVASLTLYTDSLMIDLIGACVKELEIDYSNNQ